MTVRELRQKLFEIEDQEQEVRVLASIEQSCSNCYNKEKYGTELAFNGVINNCLSVAMYDNDEG